MSQHVGVFELTQGVCVDWKLDALAQDSWPSKTGLREIPYGLREVPG